jgi:hypothetical protein
VACTACRQTNCTNYNGLGFDLINGCFVAVKPSSNTDYGTPLNDPAFIQDCVSLVSCAYSKKCGFSTTGSAECFCGTASIDACFATAGAANGECAAEFQTAGRSTVLNDLSLRTSDLAYPLGWANFMLECDTTLCATACVPN